MIVDLLAPARLSSRPQLDRLVAADIDGLITALHRGAAPLRDRPGVIRDHEPTDAVLLPRYLLREHEHLASLPSVPAEIRSAEHLVTPFGMCMSRIVLEINSVAGLPEVEEALSAWLDTRFTALSQRLAASLDAVGLLQREEPRPRDLPYDRFLWWHRVLEHTPSADGSQIDAWHRAPDVELRPGTVLRIGDGYTWLATASSEERDEIIEGLTAATQTWLVIDRMQRRLAEQAAALRRSRGLAAPDLRDEQDRAIAASEEAILEGQLLLEEHRYTAGARRQALDAAATSWRMDLSLAAVFDAAEGVRDMVDRRVQQRRENQADQLNKLLAALTMVTAFSILLLIFETSVGGPIDSLVPLRVVVATSVTVLTGAAVWAVLRRR